MKIKVHFEQRVYYSGELEMSQIDYDRWCHALDNTRGRALQKINEDLFALCNFDENKPSDFGDPNCETFEEE